jgi:hypothetical protein
MRDIHTKLTTLLGIYQRRAAPADAHRKHSNDDKHKKDVHYYASQTELTHS